MSSKCILSGSLWTKFTIGVGETSLRIVSKTSFANVSSSFSFSSSSVGVDVIGLHVMVAECIHEDECDEMRFVNEDGLDENTFQLSSIG